MASVSLFSLMGKIAVDGVEQTTKDLKDVSKTGKDAEGTLSTSFTNIANKAGELGKKAALGLAAIGTAAIATVEGTKEFRQDLGKLTTAFETLAVDGAAQGTKTFKELYAVLGEDDTAIEAANNLVALTGDTQNLNEWTNILTGVYASFGDSLPIEGLAEAANETARTGAVTGGLADAINWAAASGETFGVKLKANTKANEEWNNAVKSATTAEEFFNLALQDCATASEREKLIRETLNGLYGESAEVYKDTNKSVMDNNTAQAELNLKMAEMAEKLEPLVTKGKIFLAEVLEKISPALQWAIDNMNILAPIVLTFVGALLALGIAGKIATFINTIKTLQTAFAALNITMSLNPIGLVIAAVVALIAIFVTLWNNCEGFRNFWIGLWENIKSAFNTAVEGIKVGIENVKIFFQNLWIGIQAVWDGIILGIKIFVGIVAAIFDAAFQIITLPFRLIWENCKEYVFAAWEWIKEKVTIGINAVKDVITKVSNAIKTFFSTVWNAIKNVFTTVWNAIVNFLTPIINKIKDVITTVFNAIKEKVTTVFNAIKNVASNVWNGIKNTVSNVVNGIKNTVSSVFNSVKNTVTNVWNGIKNAITGPIEKAKDIVKGIVDKIKGFFNFNISLPKIKLPHFSVRPSGWQIGDLLKGSIPKLGIDWYAKAMDTPMLLDKPTAFGYSSNGNIRVGGEAGDEIVGGANTIMGMIGNAVSSNNVGIEEKLDRLIGLLTNYLPAMSNQQVILNTGELVGAMVNPMDKALGKLANERRRGY